MKKIFLKTTTVLILSLTFLSFPTVIHAQKEADVIYTAQKNDSAVAEENEDQITDLKPIFITPMQGIITSRFGYRSSGFHHGLDIANQWGTNIVAIADGTVTEADWKNSIYGYTVVIDHGNGWESLYGHCGMLTVKAGQKVSAGDIIAIEGSTGRSTGPHLHLEIHKDGVFLNPENFIEIE